MDECPTEASSADAIKSLGLKTQQNDIGVIASGIVTYVKAKAEQLKLTSAVIPGLDYVKVFIDTIMTLSIMSETPQLSEK